MALQVRSGAGGKPYVWHVHSNGRSHAFNVYGGKPVRLSVCGSVKLDRDPIDAPLTYPCCNCLRWTGTKG